MSTPAELSATDLARACMPLARQLVGEAAEIALELYGSARWSKKPCGSAVSEADLRVQERVAGRLAEVRPDDVLIAEEHGAVEASDARCVWVLDPIDGTEAFIRRMPTWCVALGLLVDGQAALGVVTMPASGDLFVGGLGIPATRNERLIRVAAPGDGMIPTLFVTASAQEFFPDLPVHGRRVSLLSVAAHLCLLADGAAQVVLVSHSRLWDIAGALAILHAAGGETRMLQGGPIDLGQLARSGGTSGVALAGHPGYLAQFYEAWGR